MIGTMPLIYDCTLADKPEWWPREETWRRALTQLPNPQAFRVILLDEATYAFSLNVEQYPHIVYPAIDWNGDFQKTIDAIAKWCEDNQIDCIQFDTNAVGPYMEMANGVMFKDAETAMLFKLTWL